MNITANAASLDWRSNNHGVWKALVKDMTPDSSVTFSDGLTGTVAGRQVTVESPSMPTGFMTYTTDGNTAVFGGVLYGAGTAYDSLEAVSGGKTVRMGSYTFTGEESFERQALGDGRYRFKCFTQLPGIKSRNWSVVPNVCMADYITIAMYNAIYQSTTAEGVGMEDQYVQFLLAVDMSADDFKTGLAGKTIYYELATPTASTETAQSMPLEQGSDTIGGGSFSATYEGTEYEIQLVKGCKYIHRLPDGTEELLTGSTTVTSVNVTGAQDKLINLTHWFGKGKEPSINDFYKLYPTWKFYDIPYSTGSILNYKGTGVQTIGFNAYDHSTGTAALLGGHEWQICGTYASVSYVDQWGNAEELELDSDGSFTPASNGTLTVVGGNATDTCVHLTWSGYKNFGKDEYQWEPFARNVHGFPVLDHFQEGMNGVGGVRDELYADSKTTRIKVLRGRDLTWHKGKLSNANNYYVFWANLGSDVAFNNASGICSLFCNAYTAVSSGAVDHDNTCRFGGGSGRDIDIRCDALSGMTAEEFSEYIKDAVICCRLATPVVTQLPSPINLTYPVNDFGTEQSLPVNTTDLVTTDLHALIRYNTDYMRMNTQLSEIFPTVRSLAQQEQDGEIMKTDATAPNATVGNAYNLIDRNAAGTERQFSFDTAGGTQDITDGTAVAKKIMGTTLNLNQLVHDTNENTVESVDGNATVSDAVEGQVKHLVVSGDTVVVNQLVHEYVEKTESGTGRIWIKDAFEKEAKGLKVTAPRSVMMNQWYNGNNISLIGDNSHTYVLSSSLSAFGSNTSYKSHVCVLVTKVTGTFTSATSMSIYLQRGSTYGSLFTSLGTNNLLQGATNLVAWKVPINESTSVRLGISNNQNSTPIGSSESFTYSDIQIIDLTQYFNGNQTLIDSIQTWDDLVAYDSAFASYVPYNTGTVKGVTPALTLNGAAQPFVTAPQEMFGVDGAADEYDVVNGKFSKKISSIDLSTLTWTESSGVWTATISDIKSNTANVLSALYADIAVNGTSVSITSSSSPTGLLYYELATPVVTDVTLVAFNLVSHDNTIFQTSGDLQAGIEATYDGLSQTIALDPAHVYAFNHQYVEDSIITGESSIDCVGTEDNLVDLTQLYAGDATRIAAIHSWASLSSRIHMYRDWLPYNPGEIVNLSATIRVYQHEHAYGVVYDPSQSSPACQRVELNDGVITEVEEFTSLPAHDFKRCVMDDLATRHVNYYLDPLDSTKKADGTPSVLTGADGDVMVEIPITYWSLDEDYNGTGKILWLVSDTPFTGSEIHDFFYVSPNGDEPRTQYVGAYRAVVANAEGNALNTTEGAITQNAGTASTRLLRSVAGALPFNNVNLAAMREAAVRNGGSHVNHLFHEYLLMMMIVEQATLNCQSISMGYSNGKTNALWAWRKSGRTNYGNGTGQTMAVADTNDDDNFYSLKVNNVQLYRDVNRDADGYFAWSNHTATPTVYWTESNVPGNGATAYSDSAGTDSGYTTTSWGTTTDANKVIQFQYRGIENPFGECWEFDDGMQKYQKSILTSIKVNNIVHYVNHLKDGTGTKTAWTSEDGTSTYWTTAVAPANNSVAYSDADCTVDSGYKTTQNAFIRVDCEMWESVATADYTSTDQHATSTKVYNKNRHYWPSGSWIKKFDPRSFLPRTLGGSGTTYLCDNWYNDNGTGSRVVYVGGGASYGYYDGLAYRYVTGGLSNSYVTISGRLSA